MTEIILIFLFVLFIFIGIPISFAIGIVAFVGILMIPSIPDIVIFTKMFHGLNSFVLLAVPLFILAANLMNKGSISKKLIDFSTSLVGHIRGGLAHSNILVSMIFAGVSGSSQADTAGVGQILIPSMEEQGYDKETCVGVTAASSTLGSIIPPSITMVIYAGIANVSVAALFLTGMLPGILLGVLMMLFVLIRGKKYGYPKNERSPFKVVFKLFLESFPAFLTPLIIIGGIVTGLYTPTEAAAFACLYALFIGMFIYKTIKLRDLPEIIIDTLKLSSLSLFALATATSLGELLGYYRISDTIAGLFQNIAGGPIVFLLIVVIMFLFIGTFMDAVPAMILFVPIILPTATALGVSHIHLGIVVILTLALGLVTPPYGLCLLIASNISKISIEKAFKGVLPYLGIALIVLLFVVLFPDIIIGIPKLINPTVFT